MLRQKRKGAVILLLSLMIALLACPAASAAARLSKKKVRMYVGKTVRLKLKGSKKKAKWSSADPTVAEIVSTTRKKAVILGKKAGKTVITAKVGKEKFRCTVKVKDVKGAYRLSLDFDQTIELTPEVTADSSGAPKHYYFDINAAATPTGVEGYTTSVRPEIQMMKLVSPKSKVPSHSRLVSLETKGRYRIHVKVPNYFALVDTFAANTGPLVYRYRIMIRAGADTMQKNLTVVIRNTNPTSPAAQRFITTLIEMDQLMRADIDNGRQWTYKNKNTSTLARTFDEARRTNNLKINCVTGVQWGLLRCGAVNSNRDGIQWYGNKGIVWLGVNAEANARKYFDIIPVGNKTVKQCLADGTLRPGDIVTYKTLAHTNVYIGNGLSFDAGHANCTSGGEGAKFIRWLRDTPYLGYKVAAILRLKW